jgi:uncharacterized membrane protein SpoIIM required for sporulation
MQTIDVNRWQRFAVEIDALKSTDKWNAERSRALIGEFRALEHALEAVNQQSPNGALARSLASLRLLAADRLSLPAPQTRSALPRWVMLEVPQAFASVRSAVLIAVTLFAVFSVIGWLMVDFAPDLAGLFMDPRQMDEVRAGKVWTDEIFGVVPGSVLSVSIMLNNILVSLFAFGVGVIYGLGTLYILGLNGLMLGALLGFTYQNGVGDRLMNFIPAHGCAELFIICLAAGCGLFVGHALVHPGAKTRASAFQHAIATCTPVLLFGCAGLVVCGIIEGYVSPNPAVGLGLRWGIGLSWLAIFLIFLTGLPFRKLQADEAIRTSRLQS